MLTEVGENLQIQYNTSYIDEYFLVKDGKTVKMIDAIKAKEPHTGGAKVVKITTDTIKCICNIKNEALGISAMGLGINKYLDVAEEMATRLAFESYRRKTKERIAQ